MNDAGSIWLSHVLRTGSAATASSNLLTTLAPPTSNDSKSARYD